MGYSPWGHEEFDTTERLHFHFSLSCIGEGDGNPLQCSCLENPRDGGAWCAVYGVKQSWTRLRDLAAAEALWGVLSLQDQGGMKLSIEPTEDNRGEGLPDRSMAFSGPSA